MARRAELVSITPEVSGKIIKIAVKDNQLVKAGGDLYPGSRALSHRAGQRQRGLAKARSDLDKAEHEANRRQSLSRTVIRRGGG
jgi:multidrug resistance efflux pump